MNHRTEDVRDDANELERNAVVVLPYLDAGRRVFVATDENGWMIAHGMAKTDAEMDRVVARLYAALEDHRKRRCPLTLLPPSDGDALAAEQHGP